MKAEQLAGLGPSDLRPLANPTANLKDAQLTPAEGFVLSRVDGHTSYAEICRMTSLGREPTLEVLRKLHQLRLIVNPKAEMTPAPELTGAAPAKAAPAPAGKSAAAQGPSAASTKGSPGAAPSSSSSASSASHARPRGGPAAAPSLLELHDDGSPVAADELARGPGLDELTKARIVRLHRRLRALSPNELLGIATSADAAQVKRAYFAASKEVHPDRYYGQDLGPYRDKLSDIFTQLTLAFEQCKK